MPGPIPQMEPKIGEKEQAAMLEYLNSGGWLTEYEKTRELEERLASLLECETVWMVPNGTLAIALAVMALDLGEDAEVIVPDFTMIATANAVRLAGATPVLVDIDPDTFCLDPKETEQRISPATEAIVHVSLNGRAGDIQAIAKLADDNGLYLVEDAAQALGSHSDARAMGTFGDVGCFSFSYAKIATTGQGGAIVTDDSTIASKLRKLRDFGREESGVDAHQEFGINCKFTDLQATIGIEQVDRIDDRVDYKRWLFDQYRNRLADVPAVMMPDTDLSECTPWFIDIVCDTPTVRAAIEAELSAAEIGTRQFYPPIHTQGPYQSRETRHNEFPVTEAVSEHGLWLPSSFDLTEEDVERICTRITKAVQKME